MQIDPTNKIAQGNLLATLNNWALDIQAEGRHAEALNLLDAAIKVAPQHQNFLSNEIHITQTWVETLLAAGHWRQALALVESTAARRPGEPYYRQARWSILERHAEDLLAAGRLDQVVDLFDQVRDLYPHETEPRTIEAGVWNRAALARLAADNHQAALSTLDFALTRLPNVHVLQNNRNAIISQWCQQAVQQFDYAAARGRALYGASTVAELSDSRRQLWRYCCELELQARLQADQLTAAGQLLAEAQSLDPANPRWQTWHRQLGASLAD